MSPHTPLTTTEAVRMVGNSGSPPPLAAIARANLDPLPALQAAPTGWKLVPMEPTQEMLDEVCSSDGIEPWTDDVMASTYRAMIAAAPEVT